MLDVIAKFYCQVLLPITIGVRQSSAFRRIDMHLSASSLTGNKVRNSQGDDLGKIEDFMLDTSTGEVSYAVLSFGGVMGIGDKLFAVPLQAMQTDTERHEFVLDESKERLEKAPGFDKDNWPQTGDDQWRREVDSYYKQ
jgi:sporulation protein YlmC with PRC-barrel domain